METPLPAASDDPTVSGAPNADAPRTAAAAELFGGKDTSDDPTVSGAPNVDAPRTAAAAELFGGKDNKAPKAPRPVEDTWDAEDSLLSWRLIAAIAGVLVLVGFGAYKIFGGAKSEVKTTPAAAGQTTGASVEIVDTFSGTSADSLGKTDTGQTWEVPAGTWGKKDGHAYVVEPNKDGGGRTMALVDLGSTNGTVSANVAKMAPGWSLIFRYKGPFNYWMMTASPKFATYNLIKIADGKATPVGRIQAKQVDGTVVGVQFQGSDITILVNGVSVYTITDKATGEGTKVGIAAADGSAIDAQWSQFKATSGAAAAPGVAPAGGGKATTTAKAGGPSTTQKKDANSG